MGWDGIDRGCSKKKRFSVRCVPMGWFPHAVGRAVALALLMWEKSKQLSEEGPWSRWVGGLVGWGALGVGEQKAGGCDELPVLPERDVCD